jgi:hypothetical protein
MTVMLTDAIKPTKRNNKKSEDTASGRGYENSGNVYVTNVQLEDAEIGESYYL